MTRRMVSTYKLVKKLQILQIGMELKATNFYFFYRDNDDDTTTNNNNNIFYQVKFVPSL